MASDKLPMARANLQPPRVHEKAVQAQIVQLIRSIGGRAFVVGTTRRRGDYQGTMQSRGIPDVIGFVPVRGTRDFVHVYVEVKAEGGWLRKEQSEFLALCIAAGVEHIVGDLDAVIAWLVKRDLVPASTFPHYRTPQG